MTVCYFGLYNPDYPRNRNNISRLRKMSVFVIECNSRRKFTAGGYWFLLRNFLQTGIKSDIILVGFPGHTDVPLAWLLAKIFHKKLVFDAFISLYNTQIDDRKYVKRGTWQAYFYFNLDKFACLLSDLVLLDTNTHIDYFRKTFGLNKTKFASVLVGTDEQLFYPKVFPKNKDFVVGFHGHFLPLQGTKLIIEAANKLKNENIVFKLVGQGIEKKECEQMAKYNRLTNVEFLEPIPYAELPNFINSCDIYLGGPFFNNQKAKLVIPNKAYEAIACGKPVILGDTIANREIFTDGVDCIFAKQANIKSIVNAIMMLQNNSKLRKSIGENGYKLYNDRCSETIIGKSLVKGLKSLY